MFVKGFNTQSERTEYVKLSKITNAYIDSENGDIDDICVVVVEVDKVPYIIKCICTKEDIDEIEIPDYLVTCIENKEDKVRDARKFLGNFMKKFKVFN